MARQVTGELEGQPASQSPGTVASEVPTAAAARSRPFGWAWQHIGLVLAGATVVFVAVRIWTFAWFDTQVALTVLSAGDPTKVVLGSLIPLASVITYAIAGWALSSLLGAASPRTPRHLLAWVLALVTIPIAVLLSAWWSLLLLLPALVGIFMLRPRYQGRGWTSTGAVRVDAVFYALVAFTVVAAGFALWTASAILPTEVVAIEGREPFVGYVIGESSDWVTTMADHDREVLVVKAESVLSRTVCGGSPERILDWFATTSTPDCDDLLVGQVADAG